MEDVFHWCREGNSFQVRVWLDDTTHDLNQGDDHGFSPLHWAAYSGHKVIVEMLINRGARVNATNMGDDTALHLATAHGHRDVVLHLMRHKADLNAANEHGNSPLHYACFWGYIGIAEDLINAGARANVANKYGETPLDKSRGQTLQKLREAAEQAGQDLSRVLTYKDQWYSTKTRSRDAALSRHIGISLKELQLEEKIATSPSGVTWKGMWQGNQIVAKFLSVGEVTPRIARDFGDEFPRLRIFSHPNVLPVLACVNESPNFVVVSQHTPYGSLYQVLHERSVGVVIDAATALKFAVEIAKGMSFLHSLDPPISRLYLTSHHIMIDDDLTARINMADAKFSFQERNKVYQPAWLAPELLSKPYREVNVRAADMWSFAVLLWELATRQVPFADLSAMEVGMKVALEDLRLTIPPGIGHHMARLAKICMNEEPGKRPTFQQIVPILEKMKG